MPLTLVTGPANSGKAGAVLAAYRARLVDEPILVVPSLDDVDRFQRELAEGGAVFGVRVQRFAWLFETVAERCGAAPAARASSLQLELLAERAVRAARLRELRASARGPGFVRAVVRFVTGLERAMIAPDALERALAAWAASAPQRRYARELVELYRGYRDRLDAAGLVDDELFAWRAVDALRARPERFGLTPVCIYGFDDFTAIELDALEALARRAGAPVTVSLPYERGRPAFKAVAPVFERLAAIADEHRELPPASAHYAREARAALAHVERRLFETGGPRPDPGEAVRLLQCGGERAEVELIAASVLRVLRAGTDAGDVAVVFRDPAPYASLVEQVFGAYGIPYSIERRIPLAHTGLGRGILALLRCAMASGSADDLVTYLRTPGLLEYPRLADRLEAEARRAGARTAAEARRVWQSRRWPLDEIDRLRTAPDTRALLAELDAQVDALFARRYRRRAVIFDDAELDDPRVGSALHAALADLLDLSERDSTLGLDLSRVDEQLTRMRVWLPARRGPRVAVASPEAVRARRFDAVFVAALQLGEFPRSGRSEPFLPDDERREIARSSGLVLPLREDELDRERHLFYVCVTRARRELVLSTRFAGEDGNPQIPSFLIDDVTDVLAPDVAARAERRSLSDVTWPAASAPTEAEWRRARALSQPPPAAASQALHVGSLEEPAVLSAGALETYADCPVKWLVERVLRPDELEPDPEPLVRGAYAHAVLEQTYRELRERTGSARVTRATVATAERILLDAIRDNQPRYRISPRQARFRTQVRKLEFDLLRHLAREAARDSDFEPAAIELSFGNRDDELPPLALEPEGVTIRGRIDRVDRRGDEALVLDYKTGKQAYPVARWDEDNRLQVALYMLAVRELLDLRPVGGLYVPLSGPEPRPRGLVLRDVAAALGDECVRGDVRDDADLDAALEAARARVCDLAAQMRTGELVPCPKTCAWNGGCAYPSICGAGGTT